MKYILTLCTLLTVALFGSATLAAPGDTPESPLKVCATLPDLGSIVQDIGGKLVDVTVFVKGPEDPHFLEAKPSFIKAASEADLFVEIGMELEVGYAPAIIANSRNARISQGAPGFLDVSSAITPMEIPSGPVDRSMGDVHAGGNPHYLTDPINGIHVARLIAERLGSLRPEHKGEFDANFTAFRTRICEGLVGPDLAKKYDAEKLSQLFEVGKLESFLDSQGDRALLKGWLGMLSGHPGVQTVADHDYWPYFAKRFNVRVVGFLEPKPGVAPTTKHLGEIVDLMQRGHVKLILAVPYFDPRHASLVAERTGAKVVSLTHQVGGREGVGTYFDSIDYNIKQLAKAMEDAK